MRRGDPEEKQGDSTITEVRFRPADDGLLFEQARGTYDHCSTDADMMLVVNNRYG